MTTASQKVITPKQADIDNLVVAAAAGEVHQVTEFIEKFGTTYINEPKDGNWTALMSAAYAGQISVVKLLLEKGADLGVKTASGFTALTLSLMMHRSEVAHLLYNWPEIQRKEKEADIAVKESRIVALKNKKPRSPFVKRG